MQSLWKYGFEMLGGLALFLFGMRTLSTHLQQAAGDALRRGLRQAARHRGTGFSVGALLGFTIQSGPASVMLVGLTHAGLLSLRQAAPVVFGFNVGTTLAMQVLAFDVYALWPAPLLSGLLVVLIGRHARARDAGLALSGFGLLILGLGTLTGSLAALREPLTPWLAGIHANSLLAVLAGIAAGAVVTGLLFSSAASIGMCLALAASGVFTDIRQVYPIVLGAQLGTCLTSLLAASNANNTGRRTALLHVGFNLVNVLLGVLLLPVMPGWIERTAPADLPRQIANLHTVLRAFTAFSLLPVAGHAVDFVERLTRRYGPSPELSRLVEEDLDRPEQALFNAVTECRRLAMFCLRGLQFCASALRVRDQRVVAWIAADEAVIDRIKPAFQDYLHRVADRQLSHRQAILVTALNRCIISIERIQDHVEHLINVTERAHKARVLSLEPDDHAQLEALFALAIEALETVAASFETDVAKQDFDRMSEAILRRVRWYERRNQVARDYFADRAWRKGEGMLPAQGLFVDALANDLEEIVQHAANIATAESRSAFFLKPRKLKRTVPPITESGQDT